MFAITLDELRVAVCDYTHGTRDFTGLEADELARIDDMIRNGLRRAYYPAASGGGTHRWRFLKTRRSVDVVESVRSTKMPPDHGGFEGPLTYDSPNRSDVIRKASEQEIRRRHSQTVEFTGVPQLYCERWVAPTGVSPQTIEVEFWPTPSETATVTGFAVLRPLEPGVGREFPAGGVEHATMFRMACLAEAEMATTGQAGTYAAQFAQSLAGSIAMDQTTAMPDTLGYNGRGASDGFMRYARPVGSVSFG